MTSATIASVGVSPLVDAEWLHAHLGDARLRLLDIRSVIDKGGREAYQQAHIPGAVHTDYTREGWRATKGMASGLLPEPDQLSALFSRLGLTPDQHIVIVGAGNGPGEARWADIGIAGGHGVGILIKKGQIVRKVKESELADVLVEEVQRLAAQPPED